MFYLLQAPSERTYQYAYKDASFVTFQRSRCADCGREIAEMEYNGPHCLIVEGGSRYPDYLAFCGAGEQLFVVSERAAQVFRDNMLGGIAEFTPIQVMKEKDGELVPLPENAPGYVLIQVKGKIDLHLQKMCLKKKRLCKTCGSFEWNRQRFYPMCVDNSTWDGSDFSRIASIPAHVVCTEKVVNLIKENKLKGFAFQQINGA